MVTINYNDYKALLLYNDYNGMLPCPCGMINWNMYIAVTMCPYAVYLP